MLRSKLDVTSYALHYTTIDQTKTATQTSCFYRLNVSIVCFLSMFLNFDASWFLNDAVLDLTNLCQAFIHLNCLQLLLYWHCVFNMFAFMFRHLHFTFFSFHQFSMFHQFVHELSNHFQSISSVATTTLTLTSLQNCPAIF